MRGVYEDHSETDRSRIGQPIPDQHSRTRVDFLHVLG
jgi:hypothetical protein